MYALRNLRISYKIIGTRTTSQHTLHVGVQKKKLITVETITTIIANTYINTIIVVSLLLLLLLVLLLLLLLFFLLNIHLLHDFIYIAPLQDYYSEALSTLARLNRAVLRLE